MNGCTISARRSTPLTESRWYLEGTNDEILLCFTLPGDEEVPDAASIIVALDAQQAKHLADWLRHMVKGIRLNGQDVA